MLIYRGTILGLALATLVRAGGPAPETRQLTVCMDRGANVNLFRARAVASGLFEKIGVQLNWSSDTGACSVARNSIVIEIDYTEATYWPSGVLAKAAPYQRRNIVVNYRRVQRPSERESGLLLGYVLTHEIAHIAQAIDRHSATGIMKAHWDSGDRASIRRHSLNFSNEDIELIWSGLDNRTPDAAHPTSTDTVGAQ